MTLPLTKATNSLFKCCGKMGIYQGRQVLFILSEPDEIAGVGFIKAQTPAMIMRLRITDAPNLTIGETIEADGMLYKVIAEPRKDIHALIWTIECNSN